MKWVAVEDADTCEISDFEMATDKEVRWLLDEYKVDMSNPTKFRVQDTAENGRHIVYEGVIYKGGFGYNLWVASKYRRFSHGNH